MKQDIQGVISKSSKRFSPQEVSGLHAKVISQKDDFAFFKFDRNFSDFLKHHSFLDDVKKRFNHFVVLGTGGSSLGAQVLCNFREDSTKKITFLNNIDPITFDVFFNENELKNTFFIIVSKSGNTPETLMQALICLNKLGEAFSAQACIISEPKDSPLIRLAEKNNIYTIDHPSDVGGRFSAFTVVSLVPGYLVSVDVDTFMQSAKKENESILGNSAHPIFEWALYSYELFNQGYTQNIVMPYVDKLEPLSRWFCQLWAESLGKDGKGSTPIASLGTVDQHSQLQLYLDGPKDKIFTIYIHPNDSADFLIPSDVSKQIGMDFFADKSMGNLLVAEQKATIDVLMENGCPVRVACPKEVSVKSIGTLMVQMMWDTIATATLSKVNCFNQPAVEQGKVLAKKYLLATD